MGFPEITVNGVKISYQIVGEDGPPLVWTTRGWFPRTDECYLIAGRLSKTHRVLVWDRRNTGLSDVGFDLEAPSEFHYYADDLHAVLHELGMAPAILVGGSGGYLTSILTADLYPGDVRALILYMPPGLLDPDDEESLSHVRYERLAQLVESNGMQAAAAYGEMCWTFPAMTKRDPANFDRLTALDPTQFAAAMRRWN